jgi:hypothetical protein
VGKIRNALGCEAGPRGKCLTKKVSRHPFGPSESSFRATLYEWWEESLRLDRQGGGVAPLYTVGELRETTHRGCRSQSTGKSGEPKVYSWKVREGDDRGASNGDCWTCTLNLSTTGYVNRREW